MKSWMVIVIVLAAIVVAAWILIPRPQPTPPTPAGHIPVRAEPPHTRRDIEPVSGLPRDNEVKGKLRVKVRTKPAAGDTSQPVETVIEVIIPKDPEAPPIVVQPDTAGNLEVAAEYEDYRDPLIALRINALVGVSFDPAIGPSPYGAVSFLTIAERVRCAVGIDRFGLGPALHWEFWREFNLGLAYTLLRFDHEGNGLTGSIAYRF